MPFVTSLIGQCWKRVSDLHHPVKFNHSCFSLSGWDFDSGLGCTIIVSLVGADAIFIFWLEATEHPNVWVFIPVSIVLVLANIRGFLWAFKLLGSHRSE